MTPDESALAVLIEEADWDTLNARMDAKFSGEVIVSQMVEDHLDKAEELVENEEVAETVSEELELPESSEPEVND
ncbi:MAG: hypothetical protein AMJ56_21675 [Anaerolineae bacterium SG8_19]|nr:MAG: hypothetical protein AMJ56_21675 [Anaerolineae bacterium SG8_19]